MTYSTDRYKGLLEELFGRVQELARVKGHEYSGDDDRLANFRRIGERLSVPMETVWGVYATKHWDALLQYIADENAGDTRPRSEPIKGRVHDLLVYLTLFAAMLEEKELKK